MEEALRVAFEEHYLGLLRLCTGLSGKREIAEDVVQEAFVRAADRIAALDREDVGPYLRRVAINVWKNRLRRLAVEMRLRLMGAPHSSAGTGVEDRDAVWTAILRLPQRQRACIVLRFYEGLAEWEIAKVLRCSVGTVKSHTSRALKKLRKELGHED